MGTIPFVKVVGRVVEQPWALGVRRATSVKGQAVSSWILHLAWPDSTQKEGLAPSVPRGQDEVFKSGY